MDDAPVIVVGVDGSASSRIALAHALSDAARRGVRVRAVSAFERPEYWAESYGLPALPPTAELVARGENRLRAVVDDVRGGLGAAEAAVPVDVAAVAGETAAAR